MYFVLTYHFHQLIIKNIAIWGYDDVCRHLDNYEDIRHAYLSFIPPGNVLYSLVSENDKQYFLDLKEKVVFPLLNYLENARSQLPSIVRQILAAARNAFFQHPFCG